jgi:microcystin-dependent protein
MAPFTGQIAIFGFNFAPAGWAPCDGRLLAISQDFALMSVIQNFYGGDDKSTFALPDLQGRVAVAAGQGHGLSAYAVGDAPGGQAEVTLSSDQLPGHSHGFAASTDQATAASPKGNLLARAWRALANSDAVANFYSSHPEAAKTALAPNAIAPAGGSQPHNNLQPYLTLNLCIALQGTPPSAQAGAPPNNDPPAVFLGQIEIFAFDNVPPGWAKCQGQTLPINQNEALFSLLGTSYGGDGRTSFALPDLRGRVPVSVGGDFDLGQHGGEEACTLVEAQMPAHNHALLADASATGNGNQPGSTTVLGQSSGTVLPSGPAFSANLYDGGVKACSCIR